MARAVAQVEVIANWTVLDFDSHEWFASLDSLAILCARLNNNLPLIINLKY